MKRKLAISLVCIILLFSGYKFFKSLTGPVSYFSEYQERHQHLISRISEDLFFAGEKVHFTSPDAYHKYYKELKINTTKNSSTRLILYNVKIWMPQIEEVLRANKIPEDFKYLAVAESNLSNAVSPKGSAGFWQLQEATAVELGLEVNEEVDERYHPQKSTKAACKYFKQAYKIFGNWTSAAAAYNRGINGLLRAFNDQSVNSYYELALNQETSKYIYKVLAFKDLINNPRKYNMKLSKARKPQVTMLRVDTSICDLPKFAKSLNVDYETLKEYNPWLLSNTLSIKDSSKHYFLAIPLNSQPQKALIEDTIKTAPTAAQSEHGLSMNKFSGLFEEYMYF